MHNDDRRHDEGFEDIRADDAADRSYLEETATEASFDGIDRDRNRDQDSIDDDRERSTNTDSNAVGLSGLALALSLLALFVLPLILGAAGIIIGFISRRRGAGAMALWAIGLGVVAVLISLFFAPFI
ncbi:DUF4190 domain-containing protein [Aureibacillus halotolerans]|uniref:DUF308 domain-containing protein n=1 Tax=Aureibacillus halotolerans TaxID=1508390 RepID=A0A4R6U7P6_9BACI|nr:DUF4190 domain-containing protein [Aureibacillus halotolerans]TDQ41712.1 hypothetical protein EV213_103298 [Aureibacillus halotolerans]